MRREFQQLRIAMRRRAPRGFTLAELMITVALIAILVAVSVPVVSETLQRIDSRSAAREIANTFRVAREQAMSRGEVILVEIEPNQDDGRLRTYRTPDRSLRCNGIDTSKLQQVGDTVTLDQLSSVMTIRGIATRQSGGTPNFLCFTPEGTVRDPSGDIINHNRCQGENFRMWISRQGESLADAASTVGYSKPDLTGCPGSGSTWDDKDRRKIRDGRYLASLWIIDVPFNGSIRAYQ